MRPLKIALTKGRLEEKTVAMLEWLGYDCSQLRNKGRKLVLEIPNAGLEVVLAKSADVITYVENGVCDMGIVGKDTIMESGKSFYEVLDLGFGECHFALAAPKGKDFFAGYHTKVIASKYPNVAGRYFEEKNMDVNIVKIEGSVELAPILGLSDGIVDLVETGTTLKENGLEVVETIARVSARVIVNIASQKLRKEEINRVIQDMERYRRENGKS